MDAMSQAGNIHWSGSLAKKEGETRQIEHSEKKIKQETEISSKEKDFLNYPKCSIKAEHEQTMQQKSNVLKQSSWSPIMLLMNTLDKVGPNLLQVKCSLLEFIGVSMEEIHYFLDTDSDNGCDFGTNECNWITQTAENAVTCDHHVEKATSCETYSKNMGVIPKMAEPMSNTENGWCDSKGTTVFPSGIAPQSSGTNFNNLKKYKKAEKLHTEHKGKAWCTTQETIIALPESTWYW